MNKRHIIVALGMAGLVGTLSAQAPAEKPLTEQEFLKKMDAIGTPTPKPHLGLEGTGLDEKKKPVEAPKKEKGATTITSLAVTFNQKTNEAVFTGTVVVNDPEFNVECDRLDAFMKKEKEKAADADPAPGAKATPGVKPAPGTKATPTAKPPKPVPADPPPGVKPGGDAGKDKGGDKGDDKGGGLDHAIADADPGKVVLITQEKVQPDGSVKKSIGKARHATYDANTGDVVLTGNPSVLQGTNLCVATDESTVMTLNRNGSMKVVGPSKSTIQDSATIEGKDKDKDSK